MQYTLRSVPPAVDRALRERARREGKSLNEVVLEALRRSVDLAGGVVVHRSLADVAGTWVRDRKVTQALEDQRSIDPDLWT